MRGDRRLLCWAAVVLGFGLWEAACEYTRYDLRYSTATCLKFKSGTDCNERRAAWCVNAPSVLRLSPRWLSNTAAYGGPLLTWVPLALARPYAMPALVATQLWYLSLIGVVRNSHLVMPTGWDPSGHIFVYGAQLVPYFLVCASCRPSAGLPALLERAMLGWMCVLCYLSITTAAFFHTLTESFAGCLLVLCLRQLLLSRRLRAMVEESRERTGLESAAPLLAVACCTWLAGSLIGWYGLTTGSRNISMLAAELGYDLAIWTMLLCSLRPGGAQETSLFNPQVPLAKEFSPSSVGLHQRSPASEDSSQIGD
ncbi:hypothetical protein AB1Y20_017591 [Prymnesium parvum]|uniref:Post-GPI attachment to proteins factor 3 n=1 Tax=Prymnesium parvum TaxID=97485 RepID=A0AB34JPI9_PRYPA